MFPVLERSTSQETSIQIPESLPRGRGALPRGQVIYIQRTRILDALVDILAERGLAARRASPTHGA
jgi:hypothetical protein